MSRDGNVHFGAVYDVSYKVYNSVTPKFCLNGSRKHLLALMHREIVDAESTLRLDVRKKIFPVRLVRH